MSGGFRFIQPSVYAVSGVDEDGRKISSIEEQNDKYQELEAAIGKWASGNGQDFYSDKHVMFDFNRSEVDLLRQLDVVGYCYGCGEDGGNEDEGDG